MEEHIGSCVRMCSLKIQSNKRCQHIVNSETKSGVFVSRPKSTILFGQVEGQLTHRILVYIRKAERKRIRWWRRCGRIEGCEVTFGFLFGLRSPKVVLNLLLFRSPTFSLFRLHSSWVHINLKGVALTMYWTSFPFFHIFYFSHLLRVAHRYCTMHTYTSSSCSA